MAIALIKPSGIRYHVVLGAKRVVVDDAQRRRAADLAGSGDNATAVGLYSAIVTALYRCERTGSSVTTSLLADGVWSAAFRFRSRWCDAKFYGLHDRKNPAQPAAV